MATQPSPDPLSGIVDGIIANAVWGLPALLGYIWRRRWYGRLLAGFAGCVLVYAALALKFLGNVPLPTRDWLLSAVPVWVAEVTFLLGLAAAPTWRWLAAAWKRTPPLSQPAPAQELESLPAAPTAPPAQLEGTPAPESPSAQQIAPPTPAAVPPEQARWESLNTPEQRLLRALACDLENFRHDLELIHVFDGLPNQGRNAVTEHLLSQGLIQRAGDPYHPLGEGWRLTKQGEHLTSWLSREAYRRDPDFLRQESLYEKNWLAFDGGERALLRALSILPNQELSKDGIDAHVLPQFGPRKLEKMEKGLTELDLIESDGSGGERLTEKGRAIANWAADRGFVGLPGYG